MAYVPIPKDLKKVKTKVAFNLTKRQLIGFTIAGLIGIPIYLFMRKVMVPQAPVSTLSAFSRWVCPWTSISPAFMGGRLSWLYTWPWVAYNVLPSMTNSP